MIKVKKNYEPPDVYWESEPQRPPTKKEIAKGIYRELKNDTELQYELNVLLRKDKLKEIKNGR